MGVSKVVTAPGKRGSVLVVFDPKLTTRDKIESVIEETPYKIAREG